MVEHVPGHTSGHIFYYFKKEKSVFTGDTLFSFGCGRLFEGSYLEMINSLKKISKDNEKNSDRSSNFLFAYF